MIHAAYQYVTQTRGGSDVVIDYTVDDSGVVRDLTATVAGKPARMVTGQHRWSLLYLGMGESRLHRKLVRHARTNGGES